MGYKKKRKKKKMISVSQMCFTQAQNQQVCITQGDSSSQGDGVMPWGHSIASTFIPPIYCCSGATERVLDYMARKSKFKASFKNKKNNYSVAIFLEGG